MTSPTPKLKKDTNPELKPKIGANPAGFLDTTNKRKAVPSKVTPKIKIKEEETLSGKPISKIKAIDSTAALLDLAVDIHQNIEEIQHINEVYDKTISYVDNDNNSILLINKYLLSIGKPIIPVIAPAAASLFLKTVPTLEGTQGDIVLYANDGMAHVGILMSPTYGEDNKVLTTKGSLIVTEVVSSDKIKSIMR